MVGERSQETDRQLDVIFNPRSEQIQLSLWPCFLRNELFGSRLAFRHLRSSVIITVDDVKVNMIKG